jgi:hypothetical protein
MTMASRYDLRRLERRQRANAAARPICRDRLVRLLEKTESRWLTAKATLLTHGHHRSISGATD